MKQPSLKKNKKKWFFSQSESLDDAESVIKDWIFFFMAAALYDKFPGSTWIRVQVCQALKGLSHVCMVSHFTCKTYMSVNFNDTPGPTSAHRVVTVQQLCC